jgi:hypothetical protein
MDTMIRVFARRTKMSPADDLAFYDEPPLFELPDLPVKVSATFTWDIPRAFKLYDSWSHRCRDVQIGGPAFNCGEGSFSKGLFLREGVTITSRGCTRRCPWCLVPRREGQLRELRWIEPGNVIQDNNILACSQGHIERVFDMLMMQPKAAIFSGGLDARLLEPWHIDRFRRPDFRLAEAWFACDTAKSMKELDRIVDLMADFPLRKKRCYVLAGFDANDTELRAERRCERILAKGLCPFLMLYQPTYRKSYSPQWLAVQRKWTRPAAYL